MHWSLQNPSFMWLQFKFLQIKTPRIAWCFLVCCHSKVSMCKTLLCDLASPLYVSHVKTMRQELSVTVAVNKTGRADGWTLQGVTEEVRGQLAKRWHKSSAYAAHIIVHVRVFLLPKKKKMLLWHCTVIAALCQGCNLANTLTRSLSRSNIIELLKTQIPQTHGRFFHLVICRRRFPLDT